MKNLKIFLIAFITLGAVSFSHAQSKVAHISTQKLIEAMPSYQSAKSQLAKLQTSYKSQIEDMYKELQEKSKKYEAEADSKTVAENQERMKEMQEAQTRIRKFQKNAQKQLAKKQEELMKPILEKAKNAIQKVADEKGYDYVLDSTQGGGVLVADGDNLLPEVKASLGI